MEKLEYRAIIKLFSLIPASSMYTETPRLLLQIVNHRMNEFERGPPLPSPYPLPSFPPPLPIFFSPSLSSSSSLLSNLPPPSSSLLPLPLPPYFSLPLLLPQPNLSTALLYMYNNCTINYNYCNCIFFSLISTFERVDTKNFRVNIFICPYVAA